jgi:hypothetical protein
MPEESNDGVALTQHPAARLRTSERGIPLPPQSEPITPIRGAAQLCRKRAEKIDEIGLVTRPEQRHRSHVPPSC